MAGKSPFFSIRSLVVGIGRVLREAIRRAYALVLLILIGWVSWRAFDYLLVSLIVPSETPRQITALPRRMDPDLLKTQRAEWEALSAVPHARSPLAHYHRLDAWMQPDPGNDCTTSGCHSPLPHAQRKETRAFLNMHATSLHCGVCHMKPAMEPAELVWYDLTTALRSGPPAILSVLSELLQLRSAEAGGSVADIAGRRRIQDQMGAAARQSGGNPALTELANHFAAVRAESPAFDELVTAALASLPRHFRGEYGHKIALRDAASGKAVLGHPGTRDAVVRFRQRRATAGDEEKVRLLAAVHPLKRDEPLSCDACHRVEGGFIDWSSLGYPPSRVHDLEHSMLFQMIQRISEGNEFHMPGFLAPASGER